MNWLSVIKTCLFKKKKANVPKQPIIQDEVPKQVQKLPTNFTSEVVKILLKDGLTNNKSVVCSPASIDAILRVLAVGAKNSTLEEELLRVLGYANLEELREAEFRFAHVLEKSYVEDDYSEEEDDEDEDEEYEPVISYVIALWLDQRFSLDFLFQEGLRHVHAVEARAIDFRNQAEEIVNEANSWTEEQTDGLIKQCLTSNHIQDDTVSLVTNALHFKGIYQNKFYQENAKDDEFNLLNGDKIQVPFMNQVNKKYEHGNFKEYQVLKIPCVRSFDLMAVKGFSIYIFLPEEINGLPKIMDNIKVDDPDLFNLDWATMNKISIPIFNLESDISLSGSMKQLGLTLPFDGKYKDFSGIIGGSDPLYVNDIVQKCRVENNEQVPKPAKCRVENNEQVPKPANAWENTYGGLRMKEFLANRPFMFMIREDVSGTILFVGSMLDPR